MSALTAPEIILRPVISEKSIDESQRGKYTFAVHDGGQQDPDQGRRRGALQEGERDRRLGQRPHDQGQGEAPRSASSGYTTPWRKAIVTLAPGQKIEFFEGV